MAYMIRIVSSHTELTARKFKNHSPKYLTLHTKNSYPAGWQEYIAHNIGGDRTR